MLLLSDCLAHRGGLCKKARVKRQAGVPVNSSATTALTQLRCTGSSSSSAQDQKHSRNCVGLSRAPRAAAQAPRLPRPAKQVHPNQPPSLAPQPPPCTCAACP